MDKKLCECGCGMSTTVSIKTDKNNGRTKGKPARFILGHNLVVKNGPDHPSWVNGTKIAPDGRVYLFCPDHPRKNEKSQVARYVLIVEKAMGKYLSNNHIVHHVNSIVDDDENSNLVVCEDIAYHGLIHQRMRALKACGHAKWLKCRYCKTYDDPSNMIVMIQRESGLKAHHKACRSLYDKTRNNLKRVTSSSPDAFGRGLA